MLRSSAQCGEMLPPSPLLPSPSLSSAPSLCPTSSDSSAPPCCNCHSLHASRNRDGYLSCLDINRGAPLDGCECAGACPPGRCALQCCLSSRLTPSCERSGRNQEEGQPRRCAKRARSPSPTTHNTSNKRTASNPLTASPVVHQVEDSGREVVNVSLCPIVQHDNDETRAVLAIEQVHVDQLELDSPHTPPSSHTPPIAPTTSPTHRILRSHTSPTLDLADSLRYTHLQEHEAAARVLRQQQARRGRKRRALSFPTQTPTPAAQSTDHSPASPTISRPLQKRARVDPAVVPSVQEMATHGRLYDFIAAGNRHQWTATCEYILSQYTVASVEGDRAEQTRWLTRLLFLPQQVLGKLHRGGKRAHHKPTTVIKNRLLHVLDPHDRACHPSQADIHADNCSTHHTSPLSPTHSSIQPHEDSSLHPQMSTDALHLSPSTSNMNGAVADHLDGDDLMLSYHDITAAGRADRLTRHGHVRKAAHVLNSTTEKADCSDPDVLVALHALHPQLPDDAVLPSVPLSAPLLHLSAEDTAITRILYQSNNGSTAGPSGWGGNMVSVLVDSPRCRTGLIRLMQDILNNNIPEALRHHVLCSHLVALKKPTGGLRPIAVGELFYRIAAAIAVQRVAHEAAQLLAPYQMGFHTRNGCEHIIHSLQHALTNPDTPVAALQLDLTNAFNCVDRPRLLTTLYSLPQLAPIWRIVDYAYATASPLMVDGGQGQHLVSSNGVRQGDPLSSLLFCLYINNALVDVARHVPVQPYGFMDDLHVVGDPDSVMQALDRLQTSLPALGLDINTSKSHLAYFHHATTPLSHDVLSLCEDNRIPVAHNSLRALGAVVAADEATLTAELMNTTTADYATAPFFRRLTSPVLSAQSAMLLLRQCGVPKMNYLSRCIPPTCLAPVTAAFDLAVVEVAYNKLDVRATECTPSTLDALRRPLRLGGFGLTSATDTSAAAYISSLAAVAASATSLTTSIDITSPVPSDSLLHSWIESTLTTLHAQLTDANADADSAPVKVLSKLPSSPAALFTHFVSQPQHAHRLQHFLVQQATQLRYHAAVESARDVGDRVQVARLVSFSAPRASTWKTVFPNHRLHVLADSYYRVSARFNLGLRPYRTLLSDHCASCGIIDAIKCDPWHHLSCNGHKRQELTLRHDAVVHALYHHAHYSGAAAAREPSGLSTEDGRRPDLHIVIPGMSLLTDVVVSHPLAPSHVTAASNTALATANKAALRKHHKYKQLAASQDALFLPFSVETTGGMADDAEELIHQLSVTCKDHLTLPSTKPFAQAIRSSIAIAIQKGNALAVKSGYSRAVIRSA